MAEQSRAHELVQAGVALIDEVGWRSVSLRSVARAAHITPAGVYRYVDSANSLIAACRRAVGDALIALTTADPQWDVLQQWCTVHPNLADLYFDVSADPAPVVEQWEVLLRGVGVDVVSARRVVLAVSHSLSMTPGEMPSRQRLDEFVALDLGGAAIDRQRAQAWIDRHVGVEFLDHFVEAAPTAAPDPVSAAVVQLVMRLGRFPSAREVAVAVGRPVSRLYPSLRAADVRYRVNQSLTDSLVPVLLAGPGTGLERLWDFLLRAGLLGLQYPALMNVVADKPASGRSEVETRLTRLVEESLPAGPASSLVSYVLGATIDMVKRQPVAFPVHFEWMARTFAMAEAWTHSSQK